MMSKPGSVRRAQIDPSHVDSMLAKELHQMSFQDRTGIEEEIHGVQSLAVTETPELIEESLRQFQREIETAPHELKQAYEEALQRNAASRRYVQDRDFRVKFLRTEWMDPRGAVRRFLLFLEGLRRHYGPVGLERPIRHDDLDKAEKDLLRSGTLQVLPSRDRAGRLVLVSQGTTAQATLQARVRMDIWCCLRLFSFRSTAIFFLHRSSHPHPRLYCMMYVFIAILPDIFIIFLFVVMAQIKMMLYVFLVLSDDVETQKLGLIFILTCDVKFQGKELEQLHDPESRAENDFLKYCLPLRVCAYHFCLPNDGSLVHQLIWAIIMVQLGSKQRVRTRFHNPAAGAPGMGGLASTEVQYSLMTFGINVLALPITSGGQIKTKNHLQWIKTRRAIELLCEMEATRSDQEQKRQQEEESSYSNRLAIATSCGGTVPSRMDTTVSTSPHPSTFSYAAFLSTIIVHPGIHDVLLLKGGNMHHWGNIEFQGLLAARVQEYIATPSRSIGRKEIRTQVINAVHARGGQFLMVRPFNNDCATKDSGASGGSWWVENTDLVDLHDRISTALYDLNRKLEGKKKMQMSKSFTTEFSGLDNNNGNNKRRKLIGISADGSSSDDDDCGRNCSTACGIGLGGSKRN
jgi:hypothetical protein